MGSALIYIRLGRGVALVIRNFPTLEAAYAALDPFQDQRWYHY